MRFLILAALVFSALAIAAAQLGWFDPSPQPLTAAPAPVARAARPVASAEPEDGEAASAEPAPEPGEAEATEVSVVDADAMNADPAEAPLPPFQVSLSCGDFHAVATTEDGATTFAGVPTGVDCLAVARAPGWSISGKHLFAGDALSLEVSRAAALELRVADSHGHPIAGATVTVRSDDGQAIADVVGSLSTASAQGVILEGVADPPPEGAEAGGEDDAGEPQFDPTAVTLTVPPSGVVVLDSLTRGTFLVEVDAPGRASAFRDVAAASGGRTVSAFVLERAAQLTVAISGVDPGDLVVAVEQGGASVGPDEVVEGAAPPGVFHFAELRPGDAWVDVEVRGASVARQKVSLGEGEDQKLELPLSLGAVQVVVDASLPPPPQGTVLALTRAVPNAATNQPPQQQADAFRALLSEEGSVEPQLQRPPPPRPGVRVGRAVMVACGDNPPVTLATQEDHAELAAVQAGARCVAWLPEAPQIAAEVRAPGTLHLAAAPNALEVVAKDGAELMRLQLAPADGVGRPTRLTGLGLVRLANVTPGRYTLSGQLGPSPVELAIEVQPSGVQRVVVSPVAMKCFTAQVVDRATGEAIDARLVGYQKAKNGYQEVLTSDGPPCFDAQKVAVIVVSADGYAPAVLGAGATSLGTVALAEAAAGERILAEALHADESGALVVDAQGDGVPSSMGLRPGDRLMSIDGRDVAQMVPEEVQGRLSGATGASVHLAVRGSDGLRELTVILP